LLSTKAVTFGYKPTPEVMEVFATFRTMCNNAIRIAIATDAKSRFDLITNSYKHLKGFDLHSHYILNACEIAYAIFQRWRREASEEVCQILTLPHFRKAGILQHLARLGVRIPYVKRPFLKLDSETCKLDYLLLRIPTTPRHFVFIVLNGGMHQRAILADRSLKRGSVTLTETSVIISFTHQIEEIKSSGQMGIDVNLLNVTWSDSSGVTERVDISEVPEIKERYRSLRVVLGRVTNKDRRAGSFLQQKYGEREHNRCVQCLHRITKGMVEHAKAQAMIIKMEKLTGIRRLYRKGNNQGTLYRGRMNTWMFGEIQRQIEYKAAWEGIPVVYVNPRGTSRICLCGSRVTDIGNRQLCCSVCGKIWDRDELASKNIMAAPLVRAARPFKGSDDGGTRR